MRKNMETVVTALETATSLTDKTILEIGGTPEFHVPRMMAARGARRIVVSNIGHGIQAAEKKGLVEGCIEAKYADGLRLKDYFRRYSFDIVFATAVLEHIPETGKLLASIDHVLKPGGLVFLSGGPLWSSAKGHHVWVETSKGPVHFPMEDCPVPDWSHLVLSADEMAAHLAETTGFGPADIKAITDWIYGTSRINRLSEAAIAAAVDASGYTVLRKKEGRYMQRNAFFERAQAAQPDGVDITASNVHYLLQKPDNRGTFRKVMDRLIYGC